jgi:hypothetical protein
MNNNEITTDIIKIADNSGLIYYSEIHTKILKDCLNNMSNKEFSFYDFNEVHSAILNIHINNVLLHQKLKDRELIGPSA